MWSGVSGRGSVSFIERSDTSCLTETVSVPACPKACRVYLPEGTLRRPCGTTALPASRRVVNTGFPSLSSLHSTLPATGWLQQSISCMVQGFSRSLSRSAPVWSISRRGVWWRVM